MLEKILNQRAVTLYFLPFVIGSISVLSFQPFNLTIINFLVLPVFFYLIIFIKKNLKALIEKNLLKKIYLFVDHHLDLVFF